MSLEAFAWLLLVGPPAFVIGFWGGLQVPRPVCSPLCAVYDHKPGRN